MAADLLALTGGDRLLLTDDSRILLASSVIGPTQSFTLAPARHGAVAHGPTVTLTGEPIPDITARLYHRDDLVTPVAQFADARARTWRNVLNDPGTGSLVLHNDDADLAELSESDVVRFEYRNWAALAVLARERSSTTIDPGEELNQATTISGPGTLAVLDEAVVYPALGVDALPIQEDRAFDWSAVDYDDSEWTTANDLGSVTDTEINGAWYWIAGIWPDTVARWLWGTHWEEPPDYSMGQPGDCYFRKSFTLASASKAMVYAMADDEIHVFVDGVPVVSYIWENRPTPLATGTIELSAGDHVIAVKGTNGGLVGVNTSPAGIVVSLHLIDAGGTVSETATVYTDSSWKMLDYPPVVPGMTPGEVIRHVVEEAQARGALTGLTLAFDDEVDSGGEPWPTPTISTKVGTDLATFVVKEMTATYIDVMMSPGEWRLYAWNMGGAGADSDVVLHAPTDATDPDSGNLAALVHRQVS